MLCSHQFARTKDAYVRQATWDLVVIDEAHRRRNVYKPISKIANAIKAATDGAPKVLLTAAPLQNSLLELYGLVSVVDTPGQRRRRSPVWRRRQLQGPVSRTTASADFVGLKERLKMARMEAKRDEAWRDYDRATRDVEKRKEDLLDEIGRMMLTYVERDELFTVRFAVG